MNEMSEATHLTSVTPLDRSGEIVQNTGEISQGIQALRGDLMSMLQFGGGGGPAGSPATNVMASQVGQPYHSPQMFSETAGSRIDDISTKVFGGMERGGSDISAGLTTMQTDLGRLMSSMGSMGNNMMTGMQNSFSPDIGPTRNAYSSYPIPPRVQEIFEGGTVGLGMELMKPEFMNNRPQNMTKTEYREVLGNEMGVRVAEGGKAMGIQALSAAATLAPYAFLGPVAGMGVSSAIGVPFEAMKDEVMGGIQRRHIIRNLQSDITQGTAYSQRASGQGMSHSEISSLAENIAVQERGTGYFEKNQGSEFLASGTKLGLFKTQKTASAVATRMKELEPIMGDIANAFKTSITDSARILKNFLDVTPDPGQVKHIIDAKRNYGTDPGQTMSSMQQGANIAAGIGGDMRTGRAMGAQFASTSEYIRNKGGVKQWEHEQAGGSQAIAGATQGALQQLYGSKNFLMAAYDPKTGTIDKAMMDKVVSGEMTIEQVHQKAASNGMQMTPQQITQFKHKMPGLEHKLGEMYTSGQMSTGFLGMYGKDSLMGQAGYGVKDIMVSKYGMSEEQAKASEMTMLNQENLEKWEKQQSYRRKIEQAGSTEKETFKDFLMGGVRDIGAAFEASTTSRRGSDDYEVATKTEEDMKKDWGDDYMAPFDSKFIDKKEFNKQRSGLEKQLGKKVVDAMFEKGEGGPGDATRRNINVKGALKDAEQISAQESREVLTEVGIRGKAAATRLSRAMDDPNKDADYLDKSEELWGWDSAEGIANLTGTSMEDMPEVDSIKYKELRSQAQNKVRDISVRDKMFEGEGSGEVLKTLLMGGKKTQKVAAAIKSRKKVRDLRSMVNATDKAKETWFDAFTNRVGSAEARGKGEIFLENSMEAIGGTDDAQEALEDFGNAGDRGDYDEATKQLKVMAKSVWDTTHGTAKDQEGFWGSDVDKDLQAKQRAKGKEKQEEEFKVTMKTLLSETKGFMNYDDKTIDAMASKLAKGEELSDVLVNQGLSSTQTATPELKRNLEEAKNKAVDSSKTMDDLPAILSESNRVNKEQIKVLVALGTSMAGGKFKKAYDTATEKFSGGKSGGAGAGGSYL